MGQNNMNALLVEYISDADTKLFLREKERKKPFIGIITTSYSPCSSWAVKAVTARTAEAKSGCRMFLNAEL